VGALQAPKCAIRGPDALLSVCVRNQSEMYRIFATRWHGLGRFSRCAAPQAKPTSTVSICDSLCPLWYKRFTTGDTEGAGYFRFFPRRAWHAVLVFEFLFFLPAGLR
jgi:hypothetical protein